MHTRLLHGSAPNNSKDPRTLCISEYRAEDSKPLQVNHLPSRYQGEVVRGERTNRVRCSTYEMEFPEVPTGASFFSQQAKAEDAGEWVSGAAEDAGDWGAGAVQDVGDWGAGAVEDVGDWGAGAAEDVGDFVMYLF